MVTLANLREQEYPELNNIQFLDAACVSLIPQRTVKKLKNFIDYCSKNEEESSSVHHINMDRMRGKAYEEAAKLLNADVEEIALVESTTHGLNIAATSCKLKAGDKVLTTSLEFLQVAMPWCVMRKTHGITIDVVEGKNGKFFFEDFREKLDDKVKLVVLSSVQWCNGWKIDMKELGDYCKSKGIWLVVDAIQEMGVFKIDVKKFHADFIVAGGHKWMNSPFGTGILYINKETLKKIEPVFWGYLNTVDPPGGWATYFGTPSIKSVNDWEFLPSAKRFEIGGTTNYVGAISLGESLGLVNEIGIENIQKHVFDLTEYCLDNLEKLGVKLTTHRDPDHRSGVVVFRAFDTLEEDEKLLKFILSKKIFLAMRYTNNIGGIRISCQYYNTKKDLDVLFAAIKEYLGK